MKVRIPSPSAVSWLAVRFGLAAVFLYSGTAKFPASVAFAASVARFQLLPEALINPVALALPPLEIILGTALLFGPWRRQAAFGLAILCAVFLVTLISAAVRGLPVECSCFGASAAEPLWRPIVRDLLIAGAAFATYRRHSPAADAVSEKIPVQMRDLNPALRCLQ